MPPRSASRSKASGSGNLPESETKPARWPFSSCRGSHALLHPRGPEGSCRLGPDALRPRPRGDLETVPNGLAGRSAGLLGEGGGEMPALSDPPRPRCYARGCGEIALHPPAPRSTFKEIMPESPSDRRRSELGNRSSGVGVFSPRRGRLPRTRAHTHAHTRTWHLHPVCWSGSGHTFRIKRCHHNFKRVSTATLQIPRLQHAHSMISTSK